MGGELRLGIMGGTFDPIHYGHLAAAAEAQYRFQLKQVVFVPNGRPPHKKDYPVTAPHHRLEMTRLAIEDNPDFELSRTEVDRPGPSYAIDTVVELRHRYPQAELYFITGVDAVLEILTWREPQRLAALCELVAVNRPGYDLATLQQRVGEELASRVHLLIAPGVNVSSTEIRRRTAEGAPIHYLLPASVQAYIARAGLYRK